MALTSVSFLCFVATLYLLYYLLPTKHRGHSQWQILLLFSLAFYASLGLYGLLIIGLVTLWTYLGGLGIDLLRQRNQKAGKSLEAFVLVLNFLCLFFMKYAKISMENLLIPVGISFYILTSSGYLIDLSRGLVKKEQNPLKLCLFLCFFPQIVQGPITRYDYMQKELFGPHSWKKENLRMGIERTLWGFFKKLVIADRIGLAVEAISSQQDAVAGSYVFLALLCYSLQLYADFTGGIDIALGIAKLFDIDLPENFNSPYMATSLKDFWRRWHRTMSAWFQDYVFYPFSTCAFAGKVRKSFTANGKAKLGKKLILWLATLVTWACIGIWHGSGSQYLAWGLCNGLILMLSEELEPLYKRIKGQGTFWSSNLWKGIQILRTFILISLLRIFDLYTSAGQALRMLAHMLSQWNLGQVLRGGLATLNLSSADLVILAVSTLVLCLSHRFNRAWLSSKPWTCQYLLCFALFLATLLFGRYGIGYTATDFIYNRY